MALPLIYALWRISKESFVEGASATHRFWFALRSIVLLLLLFALAGFQWKTAVRQMQVVFLVDMSDSIGPEQREKSIRWMNATLSKLQAPNQAGVITFGSDAAVERFPALPRSIDRVESQINGSATNMEEAVTLAEALFSPNYQQHVVLISDGNQNAGQAKEKFEAVRGRGISTQSLYLEPTDRAEAGIESARVPDTLGLKQNFYLDVVLSTNRSQSAVVQVYRNSTLLQEGTLDLRSTQKESLRLPQRIDEPGLYRYQVMLKPTNDFRVENNMREVWVQVAGPPRLLIADEKPEELSLLAGALRNRGFQVELKRPRDFPTSLQDLLLYQAVMIRNIPASQIHTQMPLLQEYVRDFGGGFAMLGGRSSFGPGGYYKTPIEEILPVSMDLRNKKYLADVAMVIVIDKSGSMSFTDRGKQKIDLADEGGARVASLLQSTDQLGVLAVDSVPKWAYPLQKLSNTPEAVDAITSIRAGGGGIYVYSGLQAAYEALRTVKASVKHVILFADTADCEEKESATGDSSLELARRALERDNITTTSIGIGQKGDVDVGFLEDLALIAQGRFYFTNDMFTLPEIFSQESAIVQRYYINEERFTPVIQDSDPVLTGIAAAPDLLAYVATSAKPGASRGMLSHREDPVLAFWRHGLGQSIAFTSAPTADWGEPWLQWDEFERFWAQTARYLARSTGPAKFESNFTYYNNRTIVIVEALDEQGNFLNGAQFQGVFLDSSGQTQATRFTQISPGRYEAALPGGSGFFGKVFRVEGDAVLEEAVVQAPEANVAEYEIRPGGREMLKEIAGAVADSPDELRFTSRASEEVRPQQHRLLWLAAFLFLLDAAARKISLRDIKLPRKTAVALEPALASPLLRLKETKRSVQRPAPTNLEAALAREEESAPVIPPVIETPVPPPEPTDSNTLARLKEARRRKKEG